MPFQIIRADITKVKADAIVNTANPMPVFADGTDRAIYQAAGEEDLLRAREEIGEIAPGQLAVTPAFRLDAKYVFHVVGPAWQGGSAKEEDTLRSCYRNALKKAEELQLSSIAFPLLASGSYGFPKDLALQTALSEISAFLTGSTTADVDLSVLLVVFDRHAFTLSEKLMHGVQSYIDDHYVSAAEKEEYLTSYLLHDESGNVEEFASAPGPREEDILDATHALREKPKSQGKRRFLKSLKLKSTTSADSMSEDAAHSVAYAQCPISAASKPAKTLEEAVSHLGETFQERLLRLIDESGMTDAQVYKKANMSRQLFSKIRSKKTYIPTKRTAFALAIALHLNLDDTKDLIGRAGYAFSPSVLSDMITQYCIENSIYNIFEVNALLFRYEQPPLGV